MIVPGLPIVAVNAGSSSLKVAVFGADSEAPPLQGARQDRVDSAQLVAWLEAAIGRDAACLIGHRIVASRAAPAIEPVTPALVALLRQAADDDAIHLPPQLALIEAIAIAMPRARQFACSDSAFHATIPPAGRHLPIPRAFDERGLERIGFHGLSCASVVRRLRLTIGDTATNGRLVVAHLGGGCSVTAIRDGRSADTSMGFSPDGGVIMATRPGDIDPGVILAMQRRLRAPPERIAHILAFESGLRGRVGDTGDLRILLDREEGDPYAAVAIEMFCRSIARAIAGAATTIGGIDILIFTGGIGEHLAAIRSRICNALGFLGIAVDEAANSGHAARISRQHTVVSVLVTPTEEEAMIAELVRQHAVSPA